MRPVHCATALVSLLSCAGAPTTVDSGLAPDAGVHVDAGLSDAGSTDAGVDDDSHECTLNLLTDAGRYCVSVTSVRDALTDEFGTPRVFVSSRHGDWSVLAHAETVHPDGGRTNVFASGVQSRDGSFRWIRRNIASAYDSDEAGNACGASDQTPGASPAYWPSDGGSPTHFAVGGNCVAVEGTRMLIGGLGLWLLDSSGAAPVRVTPSAGDPTVARFVGLSNQQRALVSSFELRNGAAYNFVDVVDSAGAFAGHLPSDGYVGGVAGSAASVAGGVVGRGFAGGALATAVLWRTPTAQPEQLEDLGLRPLELTRVSGSLDVCGAVAGAPAFWVPPSYRLLRLESVLGDGDACVGALPGGRFLVSRVSLDGIVDSLQVRITSLR